MKYIPINFALLTPYNIAVIGLIGLGAHLAVHAVMRHFSSDKENPNAS